MTAPRKKTKRPAKTAGRPRRLKPPPLTLEQVLAWADSHYQRTGRWPAAKGGGPIPEAPAEKWANIVQVMQFGNRGFDGSLTLAQALVKYRGKSHHMQLPPLTKKMIIEWAEFHHLYTRKWPGYYSGRVLGQPHEQWSRIDGALMNGHRGLPGGSSIAKLLGKRRREPKRPRVAPLTVERILEWADAHKRRTGRWPGQKSGQVHGQPGERWVNIDAALRKGGRELPRGSSLADLFARHRGVRNPAALPKYRVKRILAWIDDHRRRTRRWPTKNSGQVSAAPLERWLAIDAALRVGLRGLHGGSSLGQFMDKHYPGRKRNPKRATTDKRRRKR